MTLFGYCRSSAAWRVRIALALKEVAVATEFRDLRAGEQKEDSYLAMNPQGFVPALVMHDGTVLTQAMAIIEWLDETHPSPPLLPGDALHRAKIRAFSLAVIADTHPVQNMTVLKGLRAHGVGQDAVTGWAAETNARGLAACEALLADQPGPFCFGEAPTLADICMVPQLGNARRYGADISGFARLLEAEAACQPLRAFAVSVPERQADFKE